MPFEEIKFSSFQILDNRIRVSRLGPIVTEDLRVSFVLTKSILVRFLDRAQEFCVKNSNLIDISIFLDVLKTFVNRSIEINDSVRPEVEVRNSTFSEIIIMLEIYNK